MLMKTNASMLVLALSEGEVKRFQRQLALLEVALRYSAGSLMQLSHHVGTIDGGPRWPLCTSRSTALSAGVCDPWLLMIVTQ